jgi:transcriptional regulator GlxA family with amidase domain
MDSKKKTREVEGLSSDACPPDPRVVVIAQVLRRDLSRRVKIDKLATTVGLSSSGLRRLFKQQIGCSIGRWQKNERLRAARILLCTTCISVKEINSAVGYHDLSHFVRDYKLTFGLSPTRFRRANLDVNAVLRAIKPTDC